mmetsp:Transcript_3205/g.9786  ORF Transcript_3205/g.9786 Transcript_3205/m.9786 type:complete len:329 (+) Transcript_3205:24-1010(+)
MPLLLELATVLAVAHAGDTPVARATAAYAGLRVYFYNGTSGFLKSCGQTGGAGSAADRFNCACETDVGPHCRNCYRWWHAVGMQTLIALDRVGAGGSFHSEVINMLDLLQQHSPYTARAYPSWVYADDYLWYVNMWLDAYSWVGGREKLFEARETFEMIWSMASDEPCGGLVWMWPDDDPRKNAITVLEAIKAAARLAFFGERGVPSYRSRALRLWEWFEDVGLVSIDTHGLVLDSVNGSAKQAYCCNATSAEIGRQGRRSTVEGEMCSPRGRTTWSYNQGMLLGVVVELAELTGDVSYLRLGVRVLNSVVTNMVWIRPHSARFPNCL